MAKSKGKEMNRDKMQILLNGIESGLTNKELIMASGYTAAYIRKVKRNIDKYKELLYKEQPVKRKPTRKQNELSAWDKKFIDDWNITVAFIRINLKEDIRLVPEQ